MWTRTDLKSCGKRAFQNNYGNSVGAALILSLVTGCAGFGVEYRTSLERSMNSWNRIQYGGNFGNLHQYQMPMMMSMLTAIGVILTLAAIVFVIFAGNVIRVGGSSFFIHNRTERAKMGRLLEGFKSGHYGNIVLTMFLRDLFTSLWTLLFVIPGIIKSYEYLMIPYILSENPGMDRKEAFLISKRMMDGEKWNAFVLSLSFIGWFFLSIFTCGLLSIFYVAPYYESTFAELYEVNKMKAYNEGYIR